MSEFTLTGLKVVREVARRGSFTAAAAALGYTQSAVSRQVAAMESAAATPLFERAARGVTPTEAGRLLARHGSGVLDQLELAARELTSLRGTASGRVRLGAFPTSVAALVPRALARFRARYPAVDVSLREGTSPSQLRRVADGTADLAIVGMPGNRRADDNGLRLEPLLDDPLLLAVADSHPLAGRGTVDVADLAGERWITGSTNPLDAFLGVWDSLPWHPEIAFVAREWTAKLGLVAAGLGITVVPGLAATAVREDVVLLRVRDERPSVRRVSLATRAGARPSEPVQALADALREEAVELQLDLRRRVGG
jgi:DNA-binding transcriptional LysR family regulator